MAGEAAAVRRCQIVGIARVDGAPGRPVEIEQMLAPDGTWSVDWDWLDCADRIRARGSDGAAGRLLDEIMRGDPARRPAGPTPE